jgi:hypothetical protein
MSSAARTNLDSNSVNVHHNDIIGTGAFRIAYSATYIGGNRNQQEAVAKTFHPKYQVLENEFYASDFAIADTSIRYAEEWNEICAHGKEILMTKGDVHHIGRSKYLVEPLIRYFTKFTSNNGWISPHEGWKGLAMEAFSHYTYHRSGGQLIVCDLQGRYRHDRFNSNRCRFELTDPAICSRRRSYGPTDLGEKGIESFFSHHQCNKFCHVGGYWSSPRVAREWFDSNSSTSMIGSTATHLLDIRNRTRFTSTLEPLPDYEYYQDSSDDDSW